MISANDFVHLPYTADLTEAGIVYARRVLPRLHSPAGRGLYDTVRRTVAATAVQLAFRRHLHAQGIVFGVRAAVPFSDPDRYNVEIGGRTCELKSFLISQPSQIEAFGANPGMVLRAPALVPLDKHAAEALRGDDLYLFALVCGVIGGGRADAVYMALPANGAFWLHAMPLAWMRPRTWAPLGPTALKSESRSRVWLELSGEDGSRTPLDLAVELAAGQRVEVDADFYSLSHARVAVKPTGRIAIRAASQKETHLINPGDWHNASFEGKDICLLGWITREQFRMRARLIPEGRRVFQFNKTRTKNLAVEVASLKPVCRLLDGFRDGSMQRQAR